MKRRELSVVPMPDKRTVRKSGPGQTVYIYYTLRAYRNKKGQPTSETALIGKLAADGVSLIPNIRYFELFTKESSQETAPVPTIDTVRSNGTTKALTTLADNMGLVSCLRQAFPDNYATILAVAMYMAECGNVMSYIDDWLDTTDAPITALASQSISRLFTAITPALRQKFLRQWTKRQPDPSHIAYDVTSISTHADTLDQAEWGHNRDGESLVQLNVGMFYGITSGLPLYYSLYNGSICDKSHFPHMMGDAAEMGIKEVEFVFDKGFVTEANLAYMDKARLHFLAPCPPSRNDVRALISNIGATVKEPTNWIGEEECYGMRTEFTLLGRSLWAHIFYDSIRFAEQERGLYAYIDKLESELKVASEKRLAKKYRDFFVFSGKTSQSQLPVFTRNETAVSEALAAIGFAVFITNDEALSPPDVLKLYRRRDEVEKAFDDLKNGIDFKRFKTHNQQTTNGKAFIGFIALILRSRMLNLLQQHKTTENMTLTKALLELRKMRYTVTSAGEKRQLPITKIQTIIAEALGLSLT